MTRATLTGAIRHIRQLVHAPASSGVTDGNLLTRFVNQREETAFAALVERHGPMVQSVCRRVLGTGPDAEDAFQATFLLLARKARSIRKRDSVGSWLHGAAHRIAMKAKTAAARRRTHEQSSQPLSFGGRGAGVRGPADPHFDAAWRELQAALDEELNALPEKYRAPLVLCYLEGLTHDEAARQLGWPPGTVKSRLARGRDRLRSRLSRRGLSLAAGAFAAFLAANTASAAVSVSLIQATVRAALLIAAGKAAGGVVSANVAALLDAAAKSMSAMKMKTAVVLLLGLCVLAAGAGVVADRAFSAGEQQANGPQPVAKGNQPAKREEAKREDAKTARTDRYGDPLPPGAVARLGTIRWRLHSGTDAMVISRDGKKLFNADPTTGISLVDMTTGKLLRQLPEDGELRKACLHHNNVVALSGDGRTAAFGVQDGTIHLLELTTGKPLRACRGHSKPIQEATLSADGRVLATRSSDGTLRVWDTDSGKQVWQSAIPDKPWRQLRPLVELALSPDGRTVAWIGDDPERVIHICDAATGVERLRLGKHVGRERQIVFAPDNQTLAVTDDAMRVQLWDLKTAKVTRTWTSNVRSFDMPSVAFAPDGKTMIATWGNDAMRLLGVASGKELWHIPRRYGSTLLDVFAFTPDGKTLVLGGGVFHRYDTATGKRLLAPGELSESFRDIAFAPDERALYSIAEDGVLRAWDSTTGKEVNQTALEPNGWGEFSPDGRVLAMWKDYTYHLYDTATRQELWKAGARSLCFSPDGRLVAMEVKDKIEVRETPTGKVIRQLGRPTERFDLVFTPDGKSLIVHCSKATTVLGEPGGSGVLRFWDIATGRERRTLPTPPCLLYRPLLSPDGRTMLVCNENHNGLILVEIATGQKRREIRFDQILSGYQFPPIVRFSPSGSYVLTGESSTAAVAVIDAFTGKLLHRQKGHQGGVGRIVFSPSSRLVATASIDATGLVWKGADFFKLARLPSINFTRVELSALWQELADGDAEKAAHAIRKLAQAPDQSVSWLRDHLRAASALGEKDRERLGQLLKSLDSNDFQVRQQAEREIEKLGEMALPNLEKALAGQPSLEVRRTIERLTAKFDPAKSTQPLQSLRAVEVLEHIGSSQAQELLKTLSKGAPEARLTQEAKATLERLPALHKNKLH